MSTAIVSPNAITGESPRSRSRRSFVYQNGILKLLENRRNEIPFPNSSDLDSPISPRSIDSQIIYMDLDESKRSPCTLGFNLQATLRPAAYTEQAREEITSYGEKSQGECSGAPGVGIDWPGFGIAANGSYIGSILQDMLFRFGVQ
jgi:hypothetical protein